MGGGGAGGRLPQVSPMEAEQASSRSMFRFRSLHHGVFAAHVGVRQALGCGADVSAVCRGVVQRRALIQQGLPEAAHLSQTKGTLSKKRPPLLQTNLWKSSLRRAVVPHCALVQQRLPQPLTLQCCVQQHWSR